MPYNNVGHPEMVTKSATVAEVFTKEKYAYLVSLLPTPEAYGEAHSRYEASFAASLKGDPDKAKACEADREVVTRHLAVLSGFAKAVSIVDPTVPESLRLGHATERVSTVHAALAIPEGFGVFYSPDGKLFCKVSRLEGAKGYQVWACEGDPGIEANWRLVASSTSCKGILIPGLNRSKMNWLRIRGMRGNTPGPWSHYVSLSPS